MIEQTHRCFYCPNSYLHEDVRNWHLLRCKSRNKILEEFKNLYLTCTQCGKKATRYDNLQRHVKSCDTKSKLKKFDCPICPKKFAQKTNMYRHMKKHKNE